MTDTCRRYTVLPVHNQSIQATTTRNRIYIGDNLHLLDWISSGETGKISIIYADPPYGRGFGDTDFYRDDHKSPKIWDEYIRPRLIAAREILPANGILAVSIDDTRIHYLRLLMDEVFGESNFVSTIIWHYAPMARQRVGHLRNAHEYVVVYARCLNQITLNPVYDEKMKFRNVIRTIRRLSRKKLLSFKDGLAALGITRDQETGDYYDWYNRGASQKDYFNSPIGDVWSIPVTNRIDRYYISGFLGQKPLELVKRLLKVFGKNDSIILDLFAGTGTTGRAVFNLNMTDGGSRSFILVQTKEEIPRINSHPRSYCLTSDITLDLMSRASQQYAGLIQDNGYQVFEIEQTSNDEKFSSSLSG
jgi:adenine-specific DNA-methyltransferase